MWPNQQQQQRPEFFSVDLKPVEWPQASYYQNMPHAEVDWTQLAQQWIAMRQAEQRQMQMANFQQQQFQQQQMHQQQMQQQQQQQFQQQQQQLRPLFPVMQRPNNNAAFNQFQQPSSSDQYQALLPTPRMPPVPYNNNSNQPQYTTRPRQPLFPQPPSARVREPFGQTMPHQQSFPPASPQRQFVPSLLDAADSYPPQRPYAFSGPRYPSTPYGSSMMRPETQNFNSPSYGTRNFSPANFQGPNHQMQNADFPSWPSVAAVPDTSEETDNADLDVQARKQLPAWIREGLEKMERGKRKHPEKTEHASSSTSERADETHIPKWRLEENEKDLENGRSDSESEADDSFANKFDAKNDSDGDVKNELAADSNVVNVEELREQLLVKMRLWMTSILLEVTSTEILSVVQNYYNTHRGTDDGEEDEDEDSKSVDSETADSVSAPVDKSMKDEDNFKMPSLPISNAPTLSKKKSRDSDSTTSTKSDRPSEKSTKTSSDYKASKGRSEKSDKSSHRTSRDGDKKAKEEKDKEKSSRKRSHSPSKSESKRRRSEKSHSHSRDEDRSRHKQHHRSKSPKSGDRRRSTNDDSSKSVSKKHKRSKSRSPRDRERHRSRRSRSSDRKRH